MACRQIAGKLTLSIIKGSMSDIVLVEEGDIEQAIVMLLEIERTLAEGTGAAPLAAILAHRERCLGTRVGLVLSGGCLAELNANIEAISHQRAFTNLPVQTVEVEFVVETRSHDHMRQTMEALARRNYKAALHLG